MRTIAFHIVSVVAITAISLLSSCSENDNPIAALQTPQVTIILETQNPQIGEPVVFRAQYTGPALVSPEYEWGFGDSSGVVSTATDTVAHVYTAEGRYDVTISIQDSSLSVPVSTASNLDVVDPRPEWTRFNRIRVKSLLKGTYRYFYHADGGTDIDSTYSATTAKTFERLDGALNTMADWQQNRFAFSSVAGAGGGMWGSSEFVAVTAYVSDDGSRLDSVVCEEKANGFTTGIYSGSSISTLGVSNIPVVSKSAEKWVYRADGPELFNQINWYTSSYGSNKYTQSTSTTLLGLEQSNDMWIEVEFYNE